MLDDMCVTDKRSDGDDSSLKAWGKIRLEDLSAEEYVRELAKQFEEFAQNSQRLEDKEVLRDHETDHEAEMANGSQPIWDTLTGNENFEANKSFLKTVLAFVEDFYRQFLSPDAAEPGLRSYVTLREKRRRRTLTEALMAFLRRLVDRRVSSFRYLLEQQIMELRDALEKELDPKMRQLLQERLALLTQLKMQLQVMERRQGADSHIFFMMLVAHTLAGASLDLHRYAPSISASENYITMHRRLERLFDVESIVHDGVKKEIGHVAAELTMQHGAYHAFAMDRRPVDGLFMGRMGAKELGISEGKFFVHAGHSQNTHGYMHGHVHGATEGGILARLAAFIGLVIQNVAMRLMMTARDALAGTIDASMARANTWPDVNARNIAAAALFKAAGAADNFMRDRGGNEWQRGVAAEHAAYCTGLDTRGAQAEAQGHPYGEYSIRCAFEFAQAGQSIKGSILLEDVTVQRAVEVGPQIQR
ncbi:hypothetical protein ACIS_00514 [Anaplasma centrale str. Israel]|uniref:Uncharacterized protein n=1 Tax=Anaplasma centrale (strain Israel) TaxID=574556 RepID=D1AUA3_ANACI|nr:hypothetical protein [Anaplasma centrale]ACZ49131.1 hypothetical protein ACIS_00514 [Anaplasma centrale str. Israel]